MWSLSSSAVGHPGCCDWMPGQRWYLPEHQNSRWWKWNWCWPGYGHETRVACHFWNRVQLEVFWLSISIVAENIVRKQVLWKQSLQELFESRITFVESSMKTRWLSLRALRKQDGFRWKLYESRRAFVESSTNEGWLSLKALRKKDGFRWKLCESRMAFVESSMKTGWLLLKALQKKDSFRWKLYEIRMAFVESSTK